MADFRLRSTTVYYTDAPLSASPLLLGLFRLGPRFPRSPQTRCTPTDSPKFEESGTVRRALTSPLTISFFLFFFLSPLGRRFLRASDYN